MVQLSTISLHLVQALKFAKELEGFGIEPSIKQILFLALRAINIDRVQELGIITFSPINYQSLSTCPH
jgi:hypothetical protein